MMNINIIHRAAPASPRAADPRVACKSGLLIAIITNSYYY